MERAEIDHFADLLTAKRGEIAKLMTEIKGALPERDRARYQDPGSFFEWPAEVQLALSGEDICANLQGALEEIDWALGKLAKAEADDERAPSVLPFVRTRAFLPERLGGAA